MYFCVCAYTFSNIKITNIQFNSLNINDVKKVVSWFNGKLKIEMNSGIEVEISRRQSYLFKDQLSF